MRKIAAIDIGTNSVLYSVFEVVRKQHLREVCFRRESPRVGSKLQIGGKANISNQSFDSLLKVLQGYLRHASGNNVQRVLIAATNPLRKADNGREVRDRLRDSLGLKVVILSPSEEARLSFLGAVGRLPKKKTAVAIDMGGGSTELVAYCGDKRKAFVSIPEGAVSLTDRFKTARFADVSRFTDYSAYLSQYNKQIATITPYLNSPVFLVGGTTSALAYIKAGERFFTGRGLAISLLEVEKFPFGLALMNLADRRSLLPDDKKRGEIIFAGAFWLWHLFKIAGLKKGIATPRGLRHGLALEYLANAEFALDL